MIEKSFYGMVYRGGIALPMGLDSVIFLMQHNDAIEMLERFSPQEAYIWATQKYTERKNQLQRYSLPLLPSMENLIYKAYHELEFMENIPTVRYFSIIAEGYAGIFSSIDTASDFLAYFHPTLLKESLSVNEALWNINWFFLQRILPRIAYINSPINYLKTLPLDVAVPLNFFNENDTLRLPDGMAISYPELKPPQHT